MARRRSAPLTSKAVGDCPWAAARVNGIAISSNPVEGVRRIRWWRTLALAFALVTVSFAGQEPEDSGPRPGPAEAAGFYPTLNAAEQVSFGSGISQFLEDKPAEEPWVEVLSLACRHGMGQSGGSAFPGNVAAGLLQPESSGGSGANQDNTRYKEES